MNEKLKELIEFINGAEREGVIEEDVKQELIDYAKWYLVNKK